MGDEGATGRPDGGMSNTYSIERKRFLEPESVIDDIEKGLSRGKRYIWPGAEVKILHWLRRFSPLLLWKVMHAANS